jgi:hypothetical protein
LLFDDYFDTFLLGDTELDVLPFKEDCAAEIGYFYLYCLGLPLEEALLASFCDSRPLPCLLLDLEALASLKVE